MSELIPLMGKLPTSDSCQKGCRRSTCLYSQPKKHMIVIPKLFLFILALNGLFVLWLTASEVFHGMLQRVRKKKQIYIKTQRKNTSLQAHELRQQNLKKKSDTC